VSRKYRNWYQNEVDEEIKGVDSRNKVKHNKRSDRLLLERIIVPMLSRGVVRVICSRDPTFSRFDTIPAWDRQTHGDG